MRKFRKLAALCAVFALMFCFTTVAYASGGEETPEVTEVPVPEATSEPNPFTPAGTGTVVNTATDEDGKQFYTITTPDENVFYLVIDLQRETDNVYFLNAVTEKDLLALAEKSGDTKENETVASTPEPEDTPDTAATPETDTKPQSQSNTGMLLLVLAVVVIGGGAGYYFKIYRPKHEQSDHEDDFDYSEEADLYDTEDMEQADELSSAEEDQDGDGEA
ncbi:hypothetical protein OXPF_32200 [Oxobacter pfennigii]|uniref:Mobile element protein CD1107-like domain-containing protein n=1 Tax=Oxobacter pfennigii TaxID=36849 RepID=A0A0P8Y8X0_9CLOT|nr:DUF4366 domain-containing protein [Oxobacter pfennigii]KPU43206.1 hypothetical protein OXPF_32200 [Oxobacter pfennigii]